MGARVDCGEVSFPERGVNVEEVVINAFFVGLVEIRTVGLIKPGGCEHLIIINWS
jgi:hypothetical protein